MPMCNAYVQSLCAMPMCNAYMDTIKEWNIVWLHCDSCEPCWVFKPTGGSPDVVHLIRHACEHLGWLLKVTTVLEAKETFVETCTNFSDFCTFWGWLASLNSFFSAFFDKANMFLCSLERKFPGELKTPPTFSSSSVPKAQKIIYQKIPPLGQ